MANFSHKAYSVKRQHRWWKTPTILLSPRYSFRVMAFAACLIAIGSLSHIWQWTNYLQIGYRIQALEKEKEALQHRISMLHIEISYLSRLDRLDRLATRQLKMQPPTLSQRLVLTSTPPNE